MNRRASQQLRLVGPVTVIVCATLSQSAPLVESTSNFVPTDLVAGGSRPIRPLQTPKHDFSSMHIESLPVKPASDLRDLVLFGDQAPSKSPSAPEFEFDLPTERPGANPWTPAFDDPRGPAGTVNNVPTPGPTALVVIAAAAFATPRRRRG